MRFPISGLIIYHVPFFDGLRSPPDVSFSWLSEVLPIKHTEAFASFPLPFFLKKHHFCYIYTWHLYYSGAFKPLKWTKFGNAAGLFYFKLFSQISNKVQIAKISPLLWKTINASDLPKLFPIGASNPMCKPCLTVMICVLHKNKDKWEARHSHCRRQQRQAVWRRFARPAAAALWGSWGATH